MKRHRVQHTSSPSLGRKPRTESHPGHHQQSLAAAWGTPAVAPPVVRLERASRQSVAKIKLAWKQQDKHADREDKARREKEAADAKARRSIITIARHYSSLTH